MAQKEGKVHKLLLYKVEKFVAEKPICREDIVFLGNSLVGGKWDTYFPAVNENLQRTEVQSEIAASLEMLLRVYLTGWMKLQRGDLKDFFLITGANDVDRIYLLIQL